MGRGVVYPEAACSPRPLDPPVTTATLPLREKMFLKSLSLTSASADILGKLLRDNVQIYEVEGVIVRRDGSSIFSNVDFRSSSKVSLGRGTRSLLVLIHLHRFPSVYKSTCILFPHSTTKVVKYCGSSILSYLWPYVKDGTCRIVHAVSRSCNQPLPNHQPISFLRCRELMRPHALSPNNLFTQLICLHRKPPLEPDARRSLPFAPQLKLVWFAPY